jgi:hypothetical protein
VFIAKTLSLVVDVERAWRGRYIVVLHSSSVARSLSRVFRNTSAARIIDVDLC